MEVLALKNAILVTNLWGVIWSAGEARERGPPLTVEFFSRPSIKVLRLSITAPPSNPRTVLFDASWRTNRRPFSISSAGSSTGGKDITDTVVSETVNKELKEHIRRHQVKLKAVQEEMRQALKNEEAGKELKEGPKLQDQMNGTRGDSVGMVPSYQEETMRTGHELR